MPPLFYSFVKVAFHLPTFLIKNDCTLREFAIKSTVDSLSPYVMHREIRDMLNDIRVFDNVTAVYKTILPNVTLLPANTVKHFKPWLHSYYVYLYSLSPHSRERSYKKLIKSMILFINENPEFGIIKNGVVRATIVSPPKIIL